MAKVPTAYEAGLGQQQVGPDQTPFQSFSTNVDQFGAVQARALSAGGKGLMLLGQAAAEISDISDQNAANRAVMETQELLNQEMLENLYSKPSTDIFINGAGPSEIYKGAGVVFGKVKEIGLAQLANDRQRTLFSAAWAKVEASEGGKASTHIASQFRAYTGEIAKQAKTATEQQLGEIAGRIEQDPGNPSYALLGEETIENAMLAGLNPTAAADLKAQWPAYVASSSVRGWFAASPNSLIASQELASGKFSDPEVQAHWDVLDPKQRGAVSKDLVGRAQKVAQLKNDQRDAADDAAEKAAGEVVNDFFVNDEPTQRPQRIEAYDKVKNSPFVKQSVKDAMRDNLYAGPVIQDYEPGLLQLEALIRDGTIRTNADAEAFRYGEDKRRVATAETMRMRIFGLVDSTQDEVFRDSFNAGLASLGIVDTASETSPVLKNRAATFKRSFLEWKQTRAGTDNDPYNNNPWAAAEAISAQIKQDIKVDPAVMTMLKSMKKRYNDSLSAGNAAGAAAARKSMDSMMNMLGISMEDVK